MPIIPFYGAHDRTMFEIERHAMDRRGAVIDALDRMLPSGLILDIGAGNGFTAARLADDRRDVIAMEPATGMIDRSVGVPWVQGDAVQLPFDTEAFDGVYATWAYFFSRDWDPTPGIRQARRVTRPGGRIIVVDSLGDDEFTALSEHDITADPAFWTQHGFACEVIDTAFEFDCLDDARRLLGLYFGDAGRAGPRRTLSYRVGLFHTVV